MRGGSKNSLTDRSEVKRTGGRLLRAADALRGRGGQRAVDWDPGMVMQAG